jgi:hypothetical protein
MFNISFQFWSSPLHILSSGNCSCSVERIPLAWTFHQTLLRHIWKFSLQWLHLHDDINQFDEHPRTTTIVLSCCRSEPTNVTVLSCYKPKWVLTAQKTIRTFIRTINQLIIFKGTIRIWPQKETNHKNKICG